MKDYKISKRQYNSHNCFICGLGNDLGLKASFFETEDGQLIGICIPKSEHQSYPNRLHGGVSAALLDEAMGRAISIGQNENIWGVTVDMALKYRKPVPYGEEIKVIARITNDRGRLFEASAEIVLPNGDIAVSATGLYMRQTANKLTDSDAGEEEWVFTEEDLIPEKITL